MHMQKINIQWEKRLTSAEKRSSEVSQWQRILTRQKERKREDKKKRTILSVEMASQKYETGGNPQIPSDQLIQKKEK